MKPWFVHKNGSCHEVVRRNGKKIYGVEMTDLICIMPHGPHKPEHDAHAKLIAAAPELLAALEFYANPEHWKEYDTGIGPMISDAEHDSGTHARAAIDKARGS